MQFNHNNEKHHYSLNQANINQAGYQNQNQNFNKKGLLILEEIVHVTTARDTHRTMYHIKFK